MLNTCFVVTALIPKYSPKAPLNGDIHIWLIESPCLWQIPTCQKILKLLTWRIEGPAKVWNSTNILSIKGNLTKFQHTPKGEPWNLDLFLWSFDVEFWSFEVWQTSNRQDYWILLRAGHNMWGSIAMAILVFSPPDAEFGFQRGSSWSDMKNNSKRRSNLLYLKCKKQPSLSSI